MASATPSFASRATSASHAPRLTFAAATHSEAFSLARHCSRNPAASSAVSGQPAGHLALLFGEGPDKTQHFRSRGALRRELLLAHVGRLDLGGCAAEPLHGVIHLLAPVANRPLLAPKPLKLHQQRLMPALLEGGELALDVGKLALHPGSILKARLQLADLTTQAQVARLHLPPAALVFRILRRQRVVHEADQSIRVGSEREDLLLTEDPDRKPPLHVPGARRPVIRTAPFLYRGIATPPVDPKARPVLAVDDTDRRIVEQRSLIITGRRHAGELLEIVPQSRREFAGAIEAKAQHLDQGGLARPASADDHRHPGAERDLE